ncbi:unnamed protein product [Prunus armeniaca]|uniref:Uncharacterized protein n=1 Tax=Prunus armeniaca TaxID=36596 RepID=A0A6J5TUB2_PRUAR|nr:unnamed protein product [Prunus armeniaca]
MFRERRRDKEIKESGVKYVRMERRIGKFMRKFVLPIWLRARVGGAGFWVHGGGWCHGNERRRNWWGSERVFF